MSQCEPNCTHESHAKPVARTRQGNVAMMRSFKAWADEDPKRAREQRYPACLVPAIGESMFMWWMRGAYLEEA